MEQVRKEGVIPMILDSGNLFFSQSPIPDNIMPQMKLKADLLAEAYTKIGIDALNVGELDLASGVKYLLDLKKRRGLPLVSSNMVYREGGKTVFQPYIIKEVNGVKVAVMGLIPALSSLEAGDDKEIQVLNPMETAKSMAGRLRKKADILIILSNLGQSEDEKLAGEVPGIDVIVGGRNRALLQTPVQVGNSLILQAQAQGKQVGRLDLSIMEHGSKFENAGQRLLFKKSIDLVEERIQTLSKAPNPNLQEMERQRSFKAQLEEEMKQVKAPAGNSFVNTITAMDDRVSKNEVIEEMIKRYKDAVAALHSDKPKPVVRDVQVKAYAGETACAGCHPRQRAFWAGTRHARAYDTLVKKNSHKDLECIGCHTTGYGMPGGFRLDMDGLDLRNVQCEACHGTGGRHTGKGDIRLTTDAAICRGCHDAARNPGFDVRSSLEKIRCPKQLP